MLIVYTAITGGFNDRLLVPAWNGPGVTFVCFSDGLRKAPGPWELRRPVWQHEQARRTARYHKLMSHKLFPAAEYTLWIDGSHQLTNDPLSLVSKHLPAGISFAAFKHPQRDCAYQELQACIGLRKDDPALMKAQIQRYKDDEYPAHAGLYETAAVLRRNDAVTENINTRWWQEIVNGSCRDQLSVNYAIWKTKQQAAASVLPGSRDRSTFLNFRPHR